MFILWSYKFHVSGFSFYVFVLIPLFRVLDLYLNLSFHHLSLCFSCSWQLFILPLIWLENDVEMMFQCLSAFFKDVTFFSQHLWPFPTTHMSMCFSFLQHKPYSLCDAYEKADFPNPKLDLINLVTYFFSYKEEGHPPKLVDLISCSLSYEVFNELGLLSPSLQ